MASVILWESTIHWSFPRCQACVMSSQLVLETHPGRSGIATIYSNQDNQLHCPVMSTALLKGEFLKLRTTTCAWVLWAFLLVVLPATDARLFTSQMSPRVVRTQYGEIRGVLITLPDTNLPLVEAYLGLQYASVLGGELRFMPPTSPMETWDGIRVALKFRPVCPQKIPKEEDLLKRLPVGRVEHFKRIIPFLERQAEECLNLNVYVPVRGKPVIFL